MSPPARRADACASFWWHSASEAPEHLHDNLNIMNRVRENAGHASAGRGSDRAARPTVSIVIPVKNDSAMLSCCLRALKTQTRAPDEIIVVDNGSTDESAQVAREAGAAVVQCLQPGIPAASATGYDHARGEIILRLDADCLPPATWVEDMVSAFVLHPEIAAFTGPAHFSDGPRLIRRPLASVYLLTYTLATVPALGHRPLFGSNLGVRRAAWARISNQAHRHDPEVHDDLDLAFHLGSHYRIGYLGSAKMGISMRPFFNARAFVRRLRRGIRTVTLHWPHDFPPRRWKMLIDVRRGRRHEDKRISRGSRVA